MIDNDEFNNFEEEAKNNELSFKIKNQLSESQNVNKEI